MLNNLTMMPIFLKSALRALSKNPVYTSISVLGLALGFACVVLIATYVYSEYQFDRFHEKSDRIYRVVMSEFSDGNEIRFATTPSPLAPPLLDAFSEIAAYTRFFPMPSAVRANDREIFQEEGFAYADSAFFEIFSFKFINGDASTALIRPRQLVLSQSGAVKLFGNDVNPMGRTVEVEGIPMVVTGIVQDLPGNSNIQFSMVASLASLEQIMGPWVLEPGRAWYFPRCTHSWKPRPVWIKNRWLTE